MQIDDPTPRWLHLPGMRKEASQSPDGPLTELRLPLIGYLPNKVRNHLVAAIGEFVGTFMFLFCAFTATQVANTAQAGVEKQDTSIANIPNTGSLIYISLGFGFSLAVNAWIFFRISGGKLHHSALSLSAPTLSTTTAPFHPTIQPSNSREPLRPKLTFMYRPL